MKRSKKKYINVRSCKPYGEQSPYWNWLETRSQTPDESHEPLEANPDMLPESANIFALKLSEAEIEQTQEVRSAMALLSPKERQVVELSMKGYSLKRVATIMQLKKSTVYCKLKRARKKIIEKMRYDSPEEVV